jgi:hypothetical protein
VITCVNSDVICGCYGEDEMRDGRPMRFSSYLRIRTPERLPAAIAAAAERRLTTSSEYARQAIIERLRKDGLNIEELDAA